jgi:hypothetical protein
MDKNPKGSKTFGKVQIWKCFSDAQHCGRHYFNKNYP